MLTAQKLVAAIALLLVFTGPCGSAAAAQARTNMLEISPYSVTLSVSRIDATARWYQDVLGFELVDSKSYPEFGTRLVFLKHGEFRIELIEDKNSSAGPPRSDPPAHTAVRGVSQFAFQVADIDEAYRALRHRGAKFAWELQRYPDLKGAFVFVRDPEGNLIQFAQRLE